ncbi:Dynein assembly factor with WDR repeat domains 1 [Apostasia shenzhenica]|uniref:Dynein assembly factor with WDR repeat domains 1 n=1 Tax=Apostasia shenzhenica TaxID=1088818 RepID=A0A2I0BGA4_9ASPA|nr:Dynein assembly factor with WDR repeat domains 1 [Apostasia shenzhenica]
MWKDVRDREAGSILPRSFASRVRSRRFAALQLSNHKEIVSPHHGAVNSLQVDLTEGRYLLSGASDASVAIYDVQRASVDGERDLISRHRSLFVVDKQHGQGHKFAISSAIWYPVDTGLFITSSFDHDVKVWDTNTTRVVMDFKMPAKVYGAAMSSVATTHMLIAAGSADVQVRLCDIASGAFTHTLSGHRDGIMTLEWSTSSEWVLMTGGCDGAIRFWDIRRAGCYLVLDQTRSQLGRRPPFSENTLKKVNGAGMTAIGKTSLKPIPSQKRITPGNGMKKLAIPLKGRSLTRGSVVQRMHPGMSSSLNRATAHYGAVTGLKATVDGTYLLSSGSDSRIRLWDVESGCNTLVNFEAMRLQTSKPLQLAITQDSSLVFVPSMAAVKVYDVWSGVTFRTLRGHYEPVNCCYLNSYDQELYTGSSDRKILVWSPPFSPAITEMEHDSKGADQDNWSD